jgi:hypothetical protein
MDRTRASAPGGTRIRAPAMAISMQGADGTSGRDGGGSAVRTTGVKASPLSDALCLASRRHANRCWGAIPCRRATSDTTAPGAAASSRMRAFSSAGQRRRPAPPVITSIRRTGRNGSSIGSSISSKRSQTEDRQPRPSAAATEGVVQTTLTKRPHGASGRFMAGKRSEAAWGRLNAHAARRRVRGL